MKNPAHGFTLIELMIVMLVIGILVAIAVPNYNAYIQRANRGHAKAALLRAAQWMERVATAQGQYPLTLAAGFEQVDGNRYAVCLVGGTLAAGVTLPAPQPTCLPAQAAPPPAPLPTAAADAFALAAYPSTTGGNANDACGAFTVTSTGVRGLFVGGVMSNDVTLLSTCWSK